MTLLCMWGRDRVRVGRQVVLSREMPHAYVVVNREASKIPFSGIKIYHVAINITIQPTKCKPMLVVEKNFVAALSDECSATVLALLDP